MPETTAPETPTPNDLPKPAAAESETKSEATQEPTGAAEAAADTKTFTQEEVNTIVSKRVAELNNKLADLEKAVAEKTGKTEEPVEDPKVKEALAEAQAALAAANKEATQAKLEAAVTTAAIKAGVAPEKVSYIQKLADVEKAVAEDGTVDGETVTEAVAKVLEGLPELAAPKAVGASPRPKTKASKMTFEELIDKHFSA